MATEYKPGNEVPASGIYEVIHDKNHTARHEVTAVKGEHFPPCKNCGNDARYVLTRAATHISHHDALKH